MREITTEEITAKVRDMIMEAECVLPTDVLAALRRASETESSAVGRDVLSQLIENAKVAAEDRMPLCQDTGVAVMFIEAGQDMHITGGALNDAVNEGVRRGYADGYLRKSIVQSPVFGRVNTRDNTPAVIHTRIVPGDKLTIHFMAKGGGSENMSGIAMLKPSEGLDGVKKFVVGAVEKSWANPCPPIIVGVGIGGTFEKAAYMAKHSLLRPLGEPNPDPELDELEIDLLIRVNSLGIGPQGFGGTVTALAVHVESHPCHIASLPVAVNIECHSHRHATVEI